MGLSWREERELKKALYASLQESRKPPTPKSETPGDESTEGDITLSGTESAIHGSEPSTPLPKQIGSVDRLRKPFNRRHVPVRSQRASSLPNIPVTKIAKQRHLRASIRPNSKPRQTIAVDRGKESVGVAEANDGATCIDDSSQDSTSRLSFSTNAPSTSNGNSTALTQENPK